jgi:hypothetical protein
VKVSVAGQFVAVDSESGPPRLTDFNSANSPRTPSSTRIPRISLRCRLLSRTIRYVTRVVQVDEGKSELREVALWSKVIDLKIGLAPGPQLREKAVVACLLKVFAHKRPQGAVVPGLERRIGLSSESRQG